MVKSGVIFAVVALVLALGFTLLTPICIPCLAIFLGLAAGYVANVFDKPRVQGQATKIGALAGLIGGVGGLIGQFIGQGINAAMVGPQGLTQIYQQLGIQIPAEMSSTYYWAGQIGLGCCIGIIALGLMAGLGALGGVLWWSTSGQKAAAAPPPPIDYNIPPTNP
jgi:predicted PurR-regulated permease PerM